MLVDIHSNSDYNLHLRETMYKLRVNFIHNLETLSKLKYNLRFFRYNRI